MPSAIGSYTIEATQPNREDIEKTRSMQGMIFLIEPNDSRFQLKESRGNTVRLIFKCWQVQIERIPTSRTTIIFPQQSHSLTRTSTTFTITLQSTPPLLSCISPQERTDYFPPRQTPCSPSPPSQASRSSASAPPPSPSPRKPKLSRPEPAVPSASKPPATSNTAPASVPSPLETAAMIGSARAVTRGMASI